MAPQKAIRYRVNIALEGKTTTCHVHHTVLYISFSLLHDYDVKIMEDVNKRRRNFIRYLHITHNTLCLPLKILDKHCSSFLLRRL